MHVELKLEQIEPPAPVERVLLHAYRIPHLKPTYEEVQKAIKAWGPDPADSEVGDPPVTDEGEEKRGTRFTVHGGIVTVFGVASWSPAVGGVIGVGLRPHENVSLGLEGRAAWLTSGVGGERISAMTAGGLLSVCGHWKWFFGCGLGHLGVIEMKSRNETFLEKEDSLFAPGGGGRVGARVSLGSFVIQSNFDALRMGTGQRLNRCLRSLRASFPELAKFLGKRMQISGRTSKDAARAPLTWD
jgi:hypothetical protein